MEDQRWLEVKQTFCLLGLPINLAGVHSLAAVRLRVETGCAKMSQSDISTLSPLIQQGSTQISC